MSMLIVELLPKCNICRSGGAKHRVYVWTRKKRLAEYETLFVLLWQMRFLEMFSGRRFRAEHEQGERPTALLYMPLIIADMTRNLLLFMRLRRWGRNDGGWLIPLFSHSLNRRQNGPMASLWAWSEITLKSFIYEKLGRPPSANSAARPFV